MEAKTNNRASTALEVFLTAVSYYGCPSRVRTDHGGENIEVGRFMIEVRGPNRGSFLTGKSTRNTRIERMLVDVKKDATHPVKLLFQELQSSGLLDVGDETDIYCLQVVFIPLLQVILNEMMVAWNCHSMRTAKGTSPNKQFLQSLFKLQQQGREFTELKQDIEMPIGFVVEDVLRENQVHVPEIDIPELSDAQRERIYRRYSVPSDSTSNRLEIARTNYLRARRFIRFCLAAEGN
ncbi:hypothetical protein OUZ56_009015 [Daphnia magna]|uniref:Integrase core domain-containing protein n=2 Tax=Daphnia magna TaxID=35525 RepID=A0ABR0AEQ4_9CRUS|nr:hypothetical protein OUZ56_009015 [Daphnia magna]